MKQAYYLLWSIFFLWTTPIIAQESEKAYDLAAKSYQIQNYAEAEKIWTDLSLNNNANAQYALAIMHLKKEAQNSSDKAAFDLLKQASAQQHVVAMFNLGVAYWEGTGTPVNQVKALNWWEIAAQEKDSGAQYNLGLAYYIGAGRAEDPDTAYYWVKQAADNGHPQAPALLDSMTAPDDSSGNTASSAAAQVDTAAASSEQITTVEQSKSSTTQSIETKEISIATSPEISTNEPTETAPVQDTFWKTIDAITQLKSRADVYSPSVATLKPGTLIQKLEIKNDWTRVQTPKGALAWVYETFVDDLENGKGLIKGSNVNIRPTPSTDNNTSAPITQLNDGDRVIILLKRAPWVQIRALQPIPAWLQSRDIAQYSTDLDARRSTWLKQAK